ncbi:MAG TPA: sigma 54-interacting transcriptional regulator [Phycisphaerae bacterium]|nr:sigma 54-interacting transcriptional regulator [Phycisphaerae bacterium]
MRSTASAVSTVVYCGDSTLLHRCRLPEQFAVEILDSTNLPQRLANLSHTVAAVIISTDFSVGGRISAPRNDLDNSAQLLGLLASIRSVPLQPLLILLTQSGLPLETCCSAVRLRVSHFIDTDADNWVERLTSVLEESASPGRASTPVRDPIQLLDTVGIRAVSPAMQSLILQVYRGAQVSDASVLIQGESGTGKQLLAEAIHHLDPKRGKMPFISVNCAAITGTLAESELFGHARGAFSGATDPRLGYFRSANRGTIFLDEISELPMNLQPKLLRVLQERRVLPVGADREESIDIRVIAASNVSLQERIARGEFRLDLFQRLNVIHLALPPLRQRTEDIPLLVQHFIRKYEHYFARPIVDVDPRVFELLKRKAGSGNVRELENIVRQALVFKSVGNRLELQDLPRFLFEGEDAPVSKEIIPSDVANNIVELIRTQRLSLKQVVDIFEKSVIRRAAETNPDISKVELAKVLGLPRRTLYYKLDSED